MKLTHVFGLVVAIHAAVFTVIFATPGCRSTGKPKPRPEQTDPARAGVGGAPVDELAASPVAPMNNADINAASPVAPVSPVAATDSFANPTFNPVAPATGPVRAAPTRPGTEPVSSALPAPDAAPRATHTVAKGDKLWTVAKKYGISVDELAAANQISKSATLHIGQQLKVPARAAAASTPGAATGNDAANTYAVKAGDNLGSIARKHGTTVAALRTANNLSGDALRVGQKLVIPGNAAPLSPTAAPESISRTPSAPATSSAPRAGGATHSVAPGDTLGSIARKYGVKVGDLATLNNITDPAKLRVGQQLRLPSGARAPATPAKPLSPVNNTPSPEPVTPPPVAPVNEPAPVAPVGVTPVEPVAPVAPVAPGAVPVIRIE